ncbi:MAG: hypothetical protein E7420_00160 [Ruminococcaceae bacterium]|nr:hypothetical protein [Oscillospiraceae bacterium]
MTGYSFTIENDSTGGGARLGSELYEAEPDGTTLMITSPTCITSYYEGYWDNNLSDPNSYTLIAPSIGPSIDSGSIMMTQTDKPFNNMEELVKYCEENPNTLTVGYPPGTIYEPRLRVVFRHFGIEDKVRWVSATNDDMITGLLGGTINIGMYSEDQGVGYLADGKLKALLLTRSSRNYTAHQQYFDSIPILPDVADDFQDMLVLMPMVLCGPANMPEEIVNYINDLCSVILENEEYAERIAGLGGISTYEPKTPEELRQIIADLDTALEVVHNAKG